MVVFNYSGAEINAKVVYYGPALSGKTTNLESIYQKMPDDAKGKMVSMKTRTDRTLFFDFLPLELGEINGYQTRILLYTVPGQVYYNATRKLVLKGADAVVFVADSSPAKMQENLDSLRNLEDNLNEHGLSLDSLPWVIQYNKRDLPDALPMQVLQQKLNLLGVPSFEAVATTGQGLYETFEAVAGTLYNQLHERLKEAQPAPSVERPAQAPSPQPEPQPVASAAPVPAAQTNEPAHAIIDDTPPTNVAQNENYSDVLDAALREVPDGGAKPAVPTQPAAAAPVAAPKQRAETAQATQAPPQEAQPAVADEPQPSQVEVVEVEEGDDFQFAALEDDKIDDEVGRVIDFEDTQITERPAQLDKGSFVLDPFQSAGAKPEKKKAKKPAPAPAPKASAGPGAIPKPAQASAGPGAIPKPAQATADEIVVRVPVVIKRSQMRKNIPVKLQLEIQVLDEPES